MARTSNIVWTVVLVVLGLIGLATAVFGPRLYREGRAFIGPIAELATAEKTLAALDEELPFEPPPNGLVREDRLRVFLDVEEELQGLYEPWQDLVDELEGRRAQSWQEARDALAATRDVHRGQQEILRAHGMSRAELVWLEDEVLPWWRQIEPLLADSDRPRIVERLRQATEDDLDLVAELQRRHGRSAALETMEGHLRGRLETLESSVMPTAEEVAPANQELFWRHRQGIAALDNLSAHSLHGILREGGQIVVNADEHGRPTLARPTEHPGQD